MDRCLSDLYGDLGKGDLKLCKECNAVNWYENKNCINCQNTSFKKLTEKKGIKLIDSEYSYYKKIGWLETEIDDILTDI